ncbi:MAG: hypothetical protein AVDCRST_MAG18-4478 [uncultured Thermomicrobiales bacterium]|uniref:Uncharacterized protein n=1 Tax=uncultured Thermomicrobiales bacterium TaxID=1645740 RepID=A0A6J4VTV0_9BACT|nr:MAG: hypothetical protein AVDCRST_MAG18-4478 [uncultured Thermomicrobiales bacterium]
MTNSVSDMRLTMIDASGSVSFVAPAHGAKVLTAACSRGPATLDELLQIARPFDAEMVDGVLDGLALFDRHNGPGNYAAVSDMLATLKPRDMPPFRVVDEATRAASLAPVSAGLVLFNLRAQRIVQVQNSYSSLLRRDRGRIRTSGAPTRHLYRYELPGEWSLVP